MPDSTEKPRTRSPINALKVLNLMREEKGLPKALKFGAQPAKVKVTKEMKEELARKVWADLYPESVANPEFVVSETMANAVVVEYEKKLKVFTSNGAVEAPKAVYTGKPRGRKPKAVSA